MRGQVYNLTMIKNRKYRGYLVKSFMNIYHWVKMPTMQKRVLSSRYLCLDVVSAEGVYAMHHAQHTCTSPSEQKMVASEDIWDKRVIKKKATHSSPGVPVTGMEGRLVMFPCKDLLKRLARAPPPSSGLELLLLRYSSWCSALSATCHMYCKDYFSYLFPCILSSWGQDPIIFYLVTTEGVQ